MTGHYFYALALPNEVKQYLKKLSEQTNDPFPFKKWVHQEDYHITLAFLGHAAEEKLSESVQLVKEKLNDIPSFKLELSNIGIFGSPRAPRILWAGVNHSETLHSLRANVYDSCVQAGFQLETRPFKPHITLARKWNGEDSFSYDDFQKYTEKNLDEFDFIANEVVLYHTHPENTPKYEKVETFQLE
ncbi:RNA 2',3'-cyclic phosphodiesterase [Lederbergia wuyishanensis]|uniref:RNA 2',3'-cyclic phosphodiesterase n=1 Tax=Lederbergia wuyishanensis TaxID=1347903 RepID=A0ABU0D504_9BACI|nr:RNA 2',3'-cyclic phosphodiesterase [Lederbergia wuyishanensis]MCJ8009546.1 RNA 2',3'-cyclic phosphodiesterase [Lederbergia wuyishanensis]MDQ0343451.1 2'-5' RNA ligase [Lederbergia wuyishanensis]